MRSNSFLCMWLGLELNILRFIPILTSMETNYLLERGVKYFLVQGLASILFIFSTVSFLGTGGRVFRLAYLRIIIKLGAAPFHGWFVNLINTVSITSLFILATVQKIRPLIIISRMVNKPFFFFILALTVFVGVGTGLSRLRFGKILATSRLVNLSWIIVRILEGLGLFFCFFSIYACLLGYILLTYEHVSSEGRVCIRGATFWLSGCFILGLISLGRMPPFLGFVGKVILIKGCMGLLSFPFILYLVFRSVAILRLYVRFVYCRVGAPANLSVSLSPPRLAIGAGAGALLLFPVRAVLMA